MNHLTQSHKIPKLGMLAALALSLAVLLSACSGSDDNDNASLSGLLNGLDAAQLESLARGSSSYYGLSSSTGIQASGVGVVEADPDIAIMSLGVETFAITVSDSRSEAAVAIDAMISALRAAGVEDDDLETQYFNIQPEYTYDQVSTTIGDGEKITRSERRLVGYRVTNTLSVTIRDLDNIGTIVDSVVDAGGNATRLNGITFTIDDGSDLEAQARELALADAVAKADLYASATGAKRGKLVTIVETSGTQYPQIARSESASFAFDGDAPATQILAGSLQVRVSVQTVFAVD